MKTSQGSAKFILTIITPSGQVEFDQHGFASLDEAEEFLKSLLAKGTLVLDHSVRDEKSGQTTKLKVGLH